MGCNCGKPKCDGQCGCKSPAVLQINNPPEYITFHKVSVPAVMGDSTTNPPAVGKYKNVLLYYEADQTSWLYSTDGIPTRLTNGITNYEDAINLPKINGNTLIGDKTGEELGLQDKLTAGENIQISDENVISATDTTYTAGDGIEINSDNEISAKIGRGLEFNADGEINVSEDYIIGFDTVADMQSSTNLVNGSYARTLGYHAKNDGGSATYKIRNVTNDDVIDGASIIEMNDSSNQLVAELILTDPINIKTFGAYGDDTHDDTQAIQKAINFAFDKNVNSVFIPSGTYKTTNPIYLLEKMKLEGDYKSVTTIHKTTHDKGNVTGLQADAIIILADSTYATGTNVDTDVRHSETISGLRLRGTITSYESGKSDEDKQYGIWCIGYAPRTTIEKGQINSVDVGIQARGMYISRISEMYVIEGYYSGIKITSECQGLIVSNINTMWSHEVGILLSGATYGSMQACLVEWCYGGVAYQFNNWHGLLDGCGYELGDGPNNSIYAIDSEITVTGGYFYSHTPAGSSNNVMIRNSGSTITITNSAIGTYGQTTEYSGKFASIYNGSIILDNTNKFYCTYSTDSTSTGFGYITINGKTYDVVRDITLLPASPTNNDYIDSSINPTKKHSRQDIYFNNISNPSTNEFGTFNNWGPAYNKGDIGFYKNAATTGRAGWICNRDNVHDLPESVGTISAVNSGNIVMTDLKLVDYDTTGIRLFRNCSIKGLTSNATARVTSISGNTLYLAETSGTFQVGEKIQLASNNFWVYGDYLQIPIIGSGTSAFRPSVSVAQGTMYFDTTLGKPIWYNGTNWVDATGATV